MMFVEIRDEVLAGKSGKSSRMGDGEYISSSDGEAITLFAEAGNLDGWTPSMTDLILDDWEIV